MTTYGKNFGFRVQPEAEARRGRFLAPTAADTPIGAPVGGNGTITADEREQLVLITGATPPVTGRHGLLVYERVDAYGTDPVLNYPSDFPKVPAGRPCQLVSDPGCKIWLANTTAAGLQFLGGATRGTPIVMVAPLNLAGIAVGDGLRPGAGTDNGGYWAETGAGEDAWLVVTFVDLARSLVEAELQF